MFRIVWKPFSWVRKKVSESEASHHPAKWRGDLSGWTVGTGRRGGIPPVGLWGRATGGKIPPLGVWETVFKLKIIPGGPRGGASGEAIGIPVGFNNQGSCRGEICAPILLPKTNRLPWNKICAQISPRQ